MGERGTKRTKAVHMTVSAVFGQASRCMGKKMASDDTRGFFFQKITKISKNLENLKLNLDGIRESLAYVCYLSVWRVLMFDQQRVTRGRRDLGPRTTIVQPEGWVNHFYVKRRKEFVGSAVSQAKRKSAFNVRLTAVRSRRPQ